MPAWKADGSGLNARADLATRKTYRPTTWRAVLTIAAESIPAPASN
jgi:hypothetical protein